MTLPNAPAPATPIVPTPSLPTPPSPPSAPPMQGQAAQPSAWATLALSATFDDTSRPIRTGLIWRIFEDAGNGAPKPGVVQRSTVAAPSVSLPPGNYVVHVSYGFASASRRITMTGADKTERLPLAAGALRLGASVASVPIPAERLSFKIFVPVGTDSEGRLVADNIKAGSLVPIPQGTYHVVSLYGESNAIMQADLKVDTGRITEATLNHRAATLTLKLVAAAGGEAFAGTAFSVLTPGGDVIREAIGAFPTVTLAEGDYVLIARHDGRVFTRNFRVESGLDRDIELVGG